MPMLRNELYHLLSLEAREDGFEARIALQPESAIYAAHFKGMPVTPGACLVQMACELASEAAGRPLDVREAADIRFLQPVLPGQTAGLSFRLTQDPADPSRWAVQVLDGETLCARMKLTLA